jgi:hypothetical protein
VFDVIVETIGIPWIRPGVMPTSRLLPDLVSEIARIPKEMEA